MKTNWRRRWVLIGILWVFISLTMSASSGHTAIPQKINYQGYLTSAAGVPVNGTVQMVFSIYNVSSGGSALWTETQAVNVAKGVYSVNLGDVTPIPLAFDVPYYLGIMVGADAEMVPRSPLTAVPYAFTATYALSAPPTWHQILPAAERFVPVMGNQAVLDRETGLVWEKSPDTNPRNWDSAWSHCVNRTVGSRKGWHLPTIQELASLIDPTASNPALPPGHPFTNVQLYAYWSNTVYPYDGGMMAAWFDLGFVSPYVKTVNTIYTWCVRGGDDR